MNLTSKILVASLFAAGAPMAASAAPPSAPLAAHLDAAVAPQVETVASRGRGAGAGARMSSGPRMSSGSRMGMGNTVRMGNVRSGNSNIANLNSGNRMGWNGNRRHVRGRGFAGGVVIGAPYYDYGYGDDYYESYAPSDGYVVVQQGDDSDSVAYCQRTFRSYDLRSQTYLGFDGVRHPCP